jgi:hypothetical protein
MKVDPTAARVVGHSFAHQRSGLDREVSGSPDHSALRQTIDFDLTQMVVQLVDHVLSAVGLCIFPEAYLSGHSKTCGLGWA